MGNLHVRKMGVCEYQRYGCDGVCCKLFMNERYVCSDCLIEFITEIEKVRGTMSSLKREYLEKQWEIFVKTLPDTFQIEKKYNELLTVRVFIGEQNDSEDERLYLFERVNWGH